MKIKNLLIKIIKQKFHKMIAHINFLKKEKKMKMMKKKKKKN